MLELKNICYKRDNKVILDNINLKIDNGFYAITGPNGSGKTTLVKIIMGIVSPDSGQIILNGKDITSLSVTSRANAGMGYAFQQPVTFKGISVYDLLKISIKRDLTQEEARSILSKVGICAIEYINREVNSSLSGGELKRIEIASVLAKNPTLSIFDEPEAGIDLWSFNNIINLFNEINSDKNNITIVVSHQEKLLSISDKIILMNDGKILNVEDKDKMMEGLFSSSKRCKKGRKCYE